MKALLLALPALLLPFSARSEAPFPFLSVNGCSGAIVRAVGSAPHQPALVLTNAHCLDFRAISGASDSLPPPGMAFFRRSEPSFLGAVALSVQTVAGRLALTPSILLYASMSGTDLAVLEVKETFSQLRATGVEAMPLTPAEFRPGAPLRIESGFYNRRFECELGEAVALREGPYHWPRAFRLGLGCAIYPGVSGSPVIDQGSGRLIGLANTHYSGDGAPCSFHNPCEILDGQERSGAVDQSYAVRIDDLAGCFARSGSPDFTQPRCPYGESHADQNPR